MKQTCQYLHTFRGGKLAHSACTGRKTTKSLHMKTVARKAADVCAAHRLLNWSQCTKGNLHRMPDLLIDIHKVDVHRQVSNFMNCKAVGRFAPFELSAVGALFERVQTHSTNAIAKVIQRLVLFQEVLHHVVMAVQENNLNSNATPSHLSH